MTITQTRPITTLDRDEREHVWRTAIHDRVGSFDLHPTGRFPQAGSIEQRDVGDLLVTDWSCTDVEGIRTSTMARRDPESVLIFTAFAGRQLIETPHEKVELRPGGVLIMSSRTTGTFVVPEALQKRTIRIPLTTLAPFDTGLGVPECLFLDIEQNPLAGLAHDYIVGLGRQVGMMSPAEVEGARNALLVLVAGMIRATHKSDASETDFLPYLRAQLEAWIIDHLTLGAVRVRDLAAAHNVATRTVHRAFAATGDTVGSIVRAHRIAGARSDLINTTSSIAGIAHRWGFCDASHLGREFRREFSMSPGDYREAYTIA